MFALTAMRANGLNMVRFPALSIEPMLVSCVYRVSAASENHCSRNKASLPVKEGLRKTKL
jgi:hypothetical protein